MIAYLTTLIVLVAISALVGLALNLQWGVAGLVNFGVVGFVALGAYTTALLAPPLGWSGAMIVSRGAMRGDQHGARLSVDPAGGQLSRDRHHRIRRGASAFCC